VTIDLEVFKTDNPQYLKELSEFKIRYIVNGTAIRNNSRNAAENCEGVLKINSSGEKVCWYLQARRHKITINANSIEYLDICATLDNDPKRFLQNFIIKCQS
jgi:hypothetical protein